MLKINLMKNYREYPVVLYTHCLLRSPVKVFEYKWFPFREYKAIKFFAKFMAMVHDYILCHENEYGIQYGSGLVRTDE